MQLILNVKVGMTKTTISAVIGLLILYLNLPGNAQQSFTLTDQDKGNPLQDAVAAYLQTLGGDSIQVEVKLSSAFDPFIEKKSQPLQVTILPLKGLHHGKQTLTFTCRDKTGKTFRRYVNVEMTLKAMVAYPRRAIKRGEILKPGMLDIRTIDLRNISLAGLALHPDALIGKAAARTLSPGSPVRWDQIKLPALVHKGDRVDVLLESSTFSVKTTAIALQTGARGDEIWVRLNNNGKRMRAVVVDTDRVSMN